MSRRLSLSALALLAATMLPGCDALDPYPTFAPVVPAGTLPSGYRVAICYNTLRTPLAQVRAAAQQECAINHPHTVAEPVDTDWYLQNCPVLLPARATFVCAAGK